MHDILDNKQNADVNMPVFLGLSIIYLMDYIELCDFAPAPTFFSATNTHTKPIKMESVEWFNEIDNYTKNQN